MSSSNFDQWIPCTVVAALSLVSACGPDASTSEAPTGDEPDSALPSAPAEGVRDSHAMSSDEPSTAATGDVVESTLCSDIVYEGDATDEALIVLLDAEARLAPDPTFAPTITQPEQGATLEAEDDLVLFTWTSPIARAAPRSAPPVRSVWDVVSSFFVSVAHAHESPVTSDIYLLKLTIPNEDCTRAILTTRREWRVDTSTWSAMRESAGETITVEITSAYLMDNRLIEGPYQPRDARTFQVAR